MKQKLQWRNGILSLGLAGLLTLSIFAFWEAHAAREEFGQQYPTSETLTHWLELSEAEWVQYQWRRDTLGRVLAEMTPYEVLGIYADDPEQRRRYARQNARFMLDFYRRTTAFEDIYREELVKITRLKSEQN